MSDLVVGVLVVLVLSGAAAFCGVMIAIRTSSKAATIVEAIVVAFTVIHTLLFHDSLLLARLLPVSNVIVLGNVIPVLVSLLAGIVAGRRSIPRWRRAVFAGLLASVGLYALARPLIRSRPRTLDRWSRDGICLQSSEASCSPCCAATLLRHHGIATSETEMVDLCLTDRGGTSRLGLYRGLRLKTHPTPFAVRVTPTTVEAIRARQCLPAILLVELREGAVVDPRYEREWGWRRGVGHAMVLFGFTDNGYATVGDPAIGKEYWRMADLHVLWHGAGLYLDSGLATPDRKAAPAK